MQYYQESIALGSKTGLSLVSDLASAHIEQLYRELWQSVYLFERQFSRFLPGSELSVFNRSAGIKQPITPEFRHLLQAARTMALETDGLYNPFILPALQAAGYRNSRVPGHEQDVVDDHSHKSVVTIDRLEIGEDWARIPYGTALDFGGCGKGYLADQIRRDVPPEIDGYWFSFGGDIAAGGRNTENRLWTVTIQSADDQTKSIGEITATSACGIATSGTTVHHGKKAGKRWHHIIDPRTNQPAETDVILATVCDDSALRADVLASCAVILGRNAGLRFLKKQGVRAAALQCRSAESNIQVAHYGNGIMVGTIHA